MTIAIWNPRYETGIAHIDSQHQALFQALNDLAESFQEGRAESQVQQSLAFLARYAGEHFQAEEEFMREAGYPGLASHAVEHNQLFENLHDLQAQVAAGKAVTMEVTVLLADWLRQHIHQSDMGYVDFLRERAQD